MRTENNIAPLSDNAEKSGKEGRKEERKEGKRKIRYVEEGTPN